MSTANSALYAQLRTLEEQLLQPSVRSDRAAVSALLDDNFVEYGSSGRIFDREAILTLLTEEDSSQLGLTDFGCDLLSPNVALVNYRSHRTSATGEKISALRSSIWKLDGDQWRIRFHQGTRQ